MTQHEQHMEAYATSILGVLQLIAKVGLYALQQTKVLSVATEDMLRKELSGYVNTANKTTVAQIKNNDDEAEKAAENKYLKLYRDSEEMVSRCLRVISVMCADKGVDEENRETIDAWSVIKDSSGNVLVTVDYWGGDVELASYQFPVSWLDLSEKQLEEKKVGCQLV